MMEPRNLTCIVCPMGCRMTVTETADGLSVTGNTCPRGEKYAVQEVTLPTRVITSSVKLTGGALPLCPVKTAGAVPKSMIPQCLAAIRTICAAAPVRIGQVLADDLCGTGVALIATANRPAVPGAAR